MKVIRPLDIIGANRLLYSNAVNTVNTWNSATTYAQSTLDRRVIVYKSPSTTSNVYYESLRGSTNSDPETSPTDWRALGSTIPEFSSNYSNALIENYSGSVGSGLLGTRVLYNNYYYQCIQTHNSPQSIENPLYWSKIGPKNSLSQFDNQVSTATYGNTLLTFTASTPNITAVGLVNAIGRRAYVTCKNYSNISGNWQVFNNTNSNNPEYDGSITQNLFSICYSSRLNLLVAAGSGGKIIYSSDAGKTWSTATTPNNTATIREIAYSEEKNIFVAVGGTTATLTTGAQVVWYSTNGTTWSATTTPTKPDGTRDGERSLNRCIYITGNINKFIAAGYYDEFYVPYIFMSTDGIVWTRISLFNTDSYSVAGVTPIARNATAIVYNPNNNVITVFGEKVTGYAVVARESSNGGSTWADGGGGGVNKTIYDIVWDPTLNKFYGCTDTGGVYIWSASGSSVTEVNIGTGIDSIVALPARTTDQTDTATNPAGYRIKFIAVSTTGKIYKFSLNSTNTLTDLQEINSSATVSLNKIYYSLTHDAVFIVGHGGTRIRSNIIYHGYKDLNTASVQNWYDYFFSEYDQQTEIAFLLNIPNYYNTETTITVVSDPVLDYATKNISMGTALIGNEISLGTTQWGVTSGIIDYSKKETDEFGITTFIQRAYSKRINVNIILPSTDLTKVQKALAAIRATPCMWIGSEDNLYDILIVYGYYRDFNIEIPYPLYSYCSLEIEGLT